jgi:hypothetical protein
MLLVNTLPFLHVLLVISVATGWPWDRALPSVPLTAALSPGWRAAVALAFLYLLPPLAARFVRLFMPLPATPALLSAPPGPPSPPPPSTPPPSSQTGPRATPAPIPAGSSAFLAWWTLFSLQTLFNRLPALEECLRLVPGLYSAWLRLWGARVGRLTYWAPGTRILDRSFVSIGDDVVFGARVRINPHVLQHPGTSASASSSSAAAAAGPELILAPVIIGHRAMIGGYALLTAGTEIACDECTPALMVSPPFSKWQGGKRARRSTAL